MAWTSALGLLCFVAVAVGGLGRHAPATGAAHVQRLERAVLHELDRNERFEIDRLPNRQVLVPHAFRRFALSADFVVPDRTAASLWALYVRQMNDGGRVFINGVLVGDVPTSNPDTAVLNVRPYTFLVPQALLRDGPNRLELRFASHDSRVFTSALTIGPADLVREHYARHQFWQITMAQVGFDFALVNAAILMGIFAMRRHELRYLLMGMTALGWAIICLAYLLPPMPAALYPYWHLVRMIGIAVVAGCCWLVMWLETEPRSPWFGRVCVAWAGVGPLAYLVNLWLLGSTDASAIERYWGVPLLALSVWPVTRLAMALLRRWDWRRAVYLAAATAGALAGAADLLLSSTGQGLFGPTGYLAQATSPLWFGAMVAVLVKDFARFLRNQRQHSELLERRLAEQQQTLARLHALDQQRESERAALAERQRIMQDMHDGLGSQLVSSLALAERGQLDAPQASVVLRECIDDLRLAIDSLAEGDDAFAVALGNLRFRMTPRLRAAGIALQWDAAALEAARMSPTLALPLLRVLQESLSNALRHAGATQIEVGFERRDDGCLVVQVRDNGRGFDPQRVRWGKGVRSIEKRARAMGARLHLDSRRGTCIRLVLPAEAGITPRDHFPAGEPRRQLAARS